MRSTTRLISTNITHRHHQVGDDHRPIEAVDRVDQQLAHAGPGEHRLGDDREGDHRAEFEPDHGDDRHQDVLQHMHADDAGRPTVPWRGRSGRSPAAWPRGFRPGQAGSPARACTARAFSAGRMQVAQAVEGEKAETRARGRARSRRARRPAASRSVTAKSRTSIRPSQKFGSEKAEDRAGHDRRVRWPVRPQARPECRAAGRAAIAMKSAVKASSRVAGSRCRISLKRRLVVDERAAEVAVQRVARRRCRTASSSGWSSPSRRLICARSSWRRVRCGQHVDRVADGVDAEEHQGRHRRDRERRLAEALDEVGQSSGPATSPSAGEGAPGAQRDLSRGEGSGRAAAHGTRPFSPLHARRQRHPLSPEGGEGRSPPNPANPHCVHPYASVYWSTRGA